MERKAICGWMDGWMGIIVVSTPAQSRVPPPVSLPTPPAHPQEKKKITRDFPPIRDAVCNSKHPPRLLFVSYVTSQEGINMSGE